MTLKEKFYKVLVFNLDIYPLEECGEIADNYAVEFAKWVTETRLYNEEVYSMNNTEELLEIFKKEQKWK